MKVEGLSLARVPRLIINDIQKEECKTWKRKRRYSPTDILILEKKRLYLLWTSVSLPRSAGTVRSGPAAGRSPGVALRVTWQEADSQGLPVGISAAAVSHGGEEGAEAVHDAAGQVQAQAAQCHHLEHEAFLLIVSLHSIAS